MPNPPTDPTFVPASSLTKDGRRNFVHPADVRGRFTRLRNLVFLGLIAIYVLLPWIEIGGHPAVFFDIQRSQFYLFGLSFNAQDVWLSFFVISGFGFALFVLTTLAGRVWCGYACPQTVFMEGVFRRVERWIEGPREARLRLNRRDWSFDKLWRKVLKHTIFLALSTAVTHVFISYFISLPALFAMISDSPGEHPVAFAWIFGFTAVTYFNFAWFREQVCLIVCPYGRLQSIMTDDHSLIIGYDSARGEPRGKAADENAGDCVDCGRCVVVCPTGIDIRNGLQIDCIACAACIDACDEIMDKLERPRGLVRYTSLNGLAGKPTRIWRPWVRVYAVLAVVGAIVAFLGFRSHEPYEANLLRLQGMPYVVDAGEIRNNFELHLINKSSAEATFEITPREDDVYDFTLPARDVTLAAMQGMKIPIIVGLPESEMRAGREVKVDVTMVGEDARRTLSAKFLGPRGKP